MVNWVEYRMGVTESFITLQLIDFSDNNIY